MIAAPPLSIVELALAPIVMTTLPYAQITLNAAGKQKSNNAWYTPAALETHLNRGSRKWADKFKTVMVTSMQDGQPSEACMLECKVCHKYLSPVNTSKATNDHNCPGPQTQVSIDVTEEQTERIDGMQPITKYMVRPLRFCWWLIAL